MKKVFRSLPILGLLAFTSPALSAPIVYNLNSQIQLGRISGSITTDGTLGALTAANITGFNLLLRDIPAGTSFNQSNSNATITLLGSALTASSSALFFNLGAANGSLLRFAPKSATSDDNTFCIDSVNSVCFSDGNDQGSQFNLRLTGQNYGAYTLRNEQFASVAPMQSGVPEPATWAMMIAGFCAMGFAIRRTAKVGTRIRFA